MKDLLKKLNIEQKNFGACIGPGRWIENSNTKEIHSVNPTDGETIASVYESSIKDYETVVQKSKDAYGYIPNLHGVLAGSPNLLEAYQNLHELFANSSFNKE